MIGVGERNETFLCCAFFIFHTGHVNGVDVSTVASVCICRGASYAQEEGFGLVEPVRVEESLFGRWWSIGPESLNVLIGGVEIVRCYGGHLSSDCELSCDAGRIVRTFVVDPSNCYEGLFCRSEIVDDPLKWGLAVRDASNKSNLSPKDGYLE